MEGNSKKKAADEVKWIKIVTDIFDDSKIKLIRKMPEGDAIIVIWLQLLCLCGKSNNAGLLTLGKIAYTDEMLATVFDRDLPIIRLALSVFTNFGMIEIYDLEGQEVIAVSNWEKHQNIEGMDKIREQNRIRKQNERARKKAALESEQKAMLPEPDEDMSRDTSRDVTGENKNKDIDIDIEDIYISDSDASDIPAKGGSTKGKKKKPKGPNPPSGIDEVEAYVKEKGLNVDAKRFYDFFAAGNWYDSNGKPVLNWKQKLLTWDKYSTGGKSNEGNTGNNEGTHREYHSDDDLDFSWH